MPSSLNHFLNLSNTLPTSCLGSFNFLLITCFGFHFLSPLRVPIIFVFLFGTYSVRDTELHQLSVHKWYPLLKYDSIRCSCLTNTICVAKFGSQNMPLYLKLRLPQVQILKNMTLYLCQLFVIDCRKINLPHNNINLSRGNIFDDVQIIFSMKIYIQIKESL